MKQYEYLAAGISIVNDICFADGSRTDNILGGCCVYAMSGIGCFTESVLPVTAGGPDFETLYGTWFAQNAVDLCGVHITMPATHHTLLRYEADGRWSEASLYGDDYFAVQKQNNMTRAAQLLPHLGPHSKGLYLDALADDGIWQELQLIRDAAPQLRIMWEPPTMCSTSSDPATKQAVRKHILACDFYSMNLGEAEAFFSVSGRDAVLAAIAALGKPCFLREGENGATWAENGEAAHLPAMLSDEGVDPTGCGNCSTAAALWARCEGYGAAEIVALANAAASLCARQRGPSPILRHRESGTARALAAALLQAEDESDSTKTACFIPPLRGINGRLLQRIKLHLLVQLLFLEGTRVRYRFRRQCGLALPAAQRYTAAQLKALIPHLRECGFSVLMLSDLIPDYSNALRHMKRTGALLKTETAALHGTLSEEAAVSLLRKGFSRRRAAYEKQLRRFAARHPWHVLHARLDASWLLQSRQSLQRAAAYDVYEAENEMLFQLFLRSLRCKQQKRLRRFARRQGMTLACALQIPLRLFTEAGTSLLHLILHEAAECCCLALIQCSDAAYTDTVPSIFDSCAKSPVKRPPKRLKLAADQAESGTKLLHTAQQFSLTLPHISENSVALLQGEMPKKLSTPQRRQLALRLELCEGEDLAAVFSDAVMRSDARLVMTDTDTLGLLLGFEAGSPLWDSFTAQRIAKKLQYYGRSI